MRLFDFLTIPKLSVHLSWYISGIIQFLSDDDFIIIMFTKVATRGRHAAMAPISSYL